jgi:hypothetical protein
MAERKSFLLRMDPGLWAELESWATDEFRSVNGQIEYLLKQAVSKKRGLTANNLDIKQQGKAPAAPAPAIEQGGGGAS